MHLLLGCTICVCGKFFVTLRPNIEIQSIEIKINYG